MRAGQLRHTVEFQATNSTGDGFGGYVQDWTAASGLSSVRVAVYPVTAKERLNAMKPEMTITHKVQLRYRSGITGAMRIKYGSRYLYIDSIINADERNRRLELLCTEQYD